MIRIGHLSIFDGIEAVRYLDCLKVSDEVIVGFRDGPNGVQTDIVFVTPDGTTAECFFELDGNPFELNLGETKRFPVVPGGSSAPQGRAPAPLAADSITGFTFGETDTGAFQPIWQASGLSGLTAAAFISILTDSTGSYARFIALFDDATRVTGGAAGDRIEVGAGNDRVEAGGGNDIVFKWRAGDLTYDGGAGRDTLSFNTSTGVTYPTDRVQQLVVDLRNGTGQNPYGGTLSLTGVENIVGTPDADIITGDNRANVIGTYIGDSAGDIINTRGGNDIVNFFSFAGFFPALQGARIDGGRGIDTLVFRYDFTGNVLDLADPSQNAGMFRDSTFSGIERYAAGPDFSTSFGAFTFRGDGGANHLEVREGVLSIDMRGGNDTLVLLSRTTSDPVTANGGNGTDRLVLLGGAGAYVLDLANPGNNTGPVAGASLAGFEVFEVGPDLPGILPSTGFFDFRGDGRGNTAIGGRNGDVLSGNGGNDTLAGNARNDTLDGGSGADVLSGGDGADRFVFGDTGAVDTVSDMQAGTDVIALRATAFAALGAAVTAAELRIGTAAQDANDRLVYDPATGLLSYDADGDGAAAAQAFADIGPGLALTAVDFLIV